MDRLSSVTHTLNKVTSRAEKGLEKSLKDLDTSSTAGVIALQRQFNIVETNYQLSSSVNKSYKDMREMMIRNFN